MFVFYQPQENLGGFSTVVYLYMYTCIGIFGIKLMLSVVLVQPSVYTQEFTYAYGVIKENKATIMTTLCIIFSLNLRYESLYLIFDTWIFQPWPRNMGTYFILSTSQTSDKPVSSTCNL